MGEKQDAYKAMKTSLRKAIRDGFYYQAIFIEYAIIEDRCSSVLKHAGVKYHSSNGNELKLMDKLRKMKGNPAFMDKYVRDRITLDLITEIENWKRKRDALVHTLAKIPYDHESIREVAENGNRLVNILDNRVKSVNWYHDRRQSVI